jgi:hypothetical protein
MIRGLVWAQWYFASGCKIVEDEDGSHSLENDSKRQHHAARVPYLGMILAAESDHLRYDRMTRQFSKVVSLEVDELVSTTLSPSSMSPHSGSDVSIESDYVMVSGSSPKQSHPTHARDTGCMDEQ